MSARKKNFDQFWIETMAVGGSPLYEAVNDLCKPLELGLDTSALLALERECETLRKHFKAAVHDTLGEVLDATDP